MRLKKWVMRMGFIVLQAAIVLALLEGLLLAGLNHPAWVRENLPRPVLVYLRAIYAYYDQRIIQYERRAARWDRDLFYTLKPGEFVFSNREFSNQFRVNSLGFRDDEAKLYRPELLVLGDSFAMGWGVGQEERFGDLLEQATGMKALNVAVSSWGTAREVIALRRVNLSRVKRVVIQFSQNDIAENHEYVMGQMKLNVQGEAVWEEAVRGYERGHRYHFGRYALKSVNEAAGKLKSLLGAVILGASARADLTDDWRLHVDNLEQIISRLRQHVPRARIVLFAPDETPLAALNHLESKKIPGLKVLNVAPHLERDRHFYVLDDHLNAAGHAELARMLLPHVRD